MSNFFKTVLGITLTIIIGAGLFIAISAVKDCDPTASLHNDVIGEILDRI